MTIFMRGIHQQKFIILCGLFKVSNRSKEKILEKSIISLIMKKGWRWKLIQIQLKTTILWDLIVGGWDVSYCPEFVLSAQGSYSTLIDKNRKLPSSNESICNSFKASEAGKVVLIIYNSSSNKKKAAAYRCMVKRTLSRSSSLTVDQMYLESFLTSSNQKCQQLRMCHHVGEASLSLWKLEILSTYVLLYKS